MALTEIKADHNYHFLQRQLLQLLRSLNQQIHKEKMAKYPYSYFFLPTSLPM